VAQSSRIHGWNLPFEAVAASDCDCFANGFVALCEARRRPLSYCLIALLCVAHFGKPFFLFWLMVECIPIRIRFMRIRGLQAVER